ncbi:helix-turn-helix domain-containing protein [Sporolactobacillus terrae]|uniref:helix-turn-helix domain-containing protein n=1 Tax=Sporolactobacillus terrae TaxID=269673 RepID=UPI00048EA38F|nr:helix-turn-helix domain-containing protein [Sporolactobacillus terrae]
MHDEERMTAQEAADYIGCAKYTIYKLARQKEIPHWRIGRNVRFSKSSIDKWKHDQEMESIAN